jgi:alpha-glucosidase
MHKPWIRCFTVALLLGVTGVAAANRLVEVDSPDGKVSLILEVGEFEGLANCPHYQVKYGGKAVIAPSRLGLELRSGSLADGFAIVRVTRSTVDSSWKPVYGERNVIRDHYQQAVVELQREQSPRGTLQIELRAYDQGAAFCYVLPQQPGLTEANIVREKTEFRLPTDGIAWATYTAQGKYTELPVSQVKPGCERPLVVRLADDLYAALAEARLVDYARMKFGPLAGHAHSLAAELGGPVTAKLPLRTPWRVVMAAHSPGQLLETNDLVLNLNEPCALPSTAWIKPGKVIREVTLSTAGCKACVDFAVKHHLQYVELDSGWYGPERTGDPRSVAVKAGRPQGGLDLPETIRYAKERGIGIILYVNQGPLEKYADEIFPLYHRWGVAGVKFGFVNVGPQRWTAWLHNAVRKAGENGLMVDIHDEYRPTGFTRTYPNLVTQEGIRGDEEHQPNEMQLMSLFCRMLAGPADITDCYYDERVDKQASHAYQLAKAVCFYSPWQFLYWYDRPAKVGDLPAKGHNILGDEPDLEFFDHCPTVWDDTKVLRGEIGRYAVIARRCGPDWFIGGMNTSQPREFKIPLSFLDAGKRYVAHIYSDDPAIPTRTHVRIDRYLVDAKAVLAISMPARGGQAIHLVPAAGSETFRIYAARGRI